MDKQSIVALDDILAGCWNGGGKCGALLKKISWDRTELGAPYTWSSKLRTAIAICLNSRVPMKIYWGKSLVQFYNDTYAAILGRNMRAMGVALDTSGETWEATGARLQALLSNSTTTWDEDIKLDLNRSGYIEEVYFTFSYSPLPGDRGIGGVSCVCYETTRTILTERRFKVLRQLSVITNARTAKDACCLSVDTLNDSQDIPFMGIYLVDNESGSLKLMKTNCASVVTPVLPDQVFLGQHHTDDIWVHELAKVALTGKPTHVRGLTTSLKDSTVLSPSSFSSLSLSSSSVDSSSSVSSFGSSLSSSGYTSSGYTSSPSTATLSSMLLSPSSLLTRPSLSPESTSSSFFTVSSSAERAAYILPIAAKNTTSSVENFVNMIGGDLDDVDVSSQTSTPPLIVGLIVMGISPHRMFDDDYKGFFSLVAGQVGVAIGYARAYEQEKERAEALAELDRSKTTFFTSVSHEFRTPITLLLGPLDDCLNDAEIPLAPHHHESLKMAKRNAQKLLRLVNTLLDFSRVGGPAPHVVYRPTDLYLFTADLASSFKPSIEKAGLKLEIDCGGVRGDDVEARAAYVDHDMWEKIIFNLLSNAVKHTFTGGIKVSLQVVDIAENTMYSDEPVKYFQCKVSDTGCGIPAAVIPRLFDKFFRVPGSKRRTTEGSGVGLALVKQLVAHHGGTISVASEVGKGTTFTIRIRAGYDHLPPAHVSHDAIPLNCANSHTYIQEMESWSNKLVLRNIRKKNHRNKNRHKEVVLSLSSDALATKKHNEQAAAAAESVCVDSARIILVDDNLDMLTYIGNLLSDFNVELYNSGDDAIDAIQSTQILPDLVLTDVMMTVMDGVTLLGILRSDPVLSEIPVILLSATGQGITEDKTLHADDYLAKPFSHGELIAKVTTHIKLGKIRRQAGEALLQASKAKSAFCTNISHELRTPLNAIMGMLNLLSETELSSEQAEFMRIVMSSSSSLLDLINDVLDLERAESGKVTLDNRAFKLSNMIEEVTSLLSERAEKGSLQMVCRLDPLVYQDFVGDPGRLKQILVNLICNSIKFTDPGGEVVVSVTVVQQHNAAASQKLPNGTPLINVRFEVKDNGIGVSPKMKDRLFIAFSQGEHAPKYGGSGLGLAISRHLVELMGGEIGVHSVLNKETIFWFHVPLFVSALNGTPNASPNTSPPSGQMPHFGSPYGSPIPSPNIRSMTRFASATSLLTNSPTIITNTWYNGNIISANNNNNTTNTTKYELPVLLGYSPSKPLRGMATVIIDPNLSSLQAISEMLEYHKMRVFQCENLNAIDFSVKIHVDFLIIDIATKDIQELQDKIRNDHKFEDVKMILIGMQRTAPENVVKSFLTYLPKPITKNKLINVLEKIARGESLDTQLVSPKREILARSRDITNKALQSLDLEEKSEAREAESPLPNDMWVLVCEDNKLNVKVIELQLKRLGWKCDVAVNGKEGLNKFKQARIPYRAIIMDVGMPVMDGITATEEIRKLERKEAHRGHMPIIALTANSFEEDKQRCLSVGMDKFLVKPANMNKLRETLLEYANN